MDLNQLRSSLNQTITRLAGELLSLRGNRPTVHLVEDIVVEAYGTANKLKQLGSISLAPPRTITITLWDASLAPAASKALSVALGVNPAVEGGSIHVNLPPLTEERRLQLIKLVKETVEESRIIIRSLRDSANKQVEQLAKDSSLSEDQKFKSKSDIQKEIDTANQKVEELLNRKIAEIQD